MSKISIKYSLEGEIRLANASNDDLELSFYEEGEKNTVTLKAKRTLKLQRAELDNVHKVAPGDKVFLNGYQSWTETKEFRLTEKLRNTKKLPRGLLRQYAFDKYGDASFFESKSIPLHGYDFFYARGLGETFIVNDNYSLAYAVFTVERKTGKISVFSDFGGITVAEGETVNLFSYYKAADYESGLEMFNRLYPEKETKKIVGYTSWYNYYQDINENIILRDLNALDGSFELFQIDDGYETFVGDWLDVDGKKFPHGLAPIAKKIKEKGLRAGIWLAPFVAETKSAIYREHRDWQKKGDDGEPVRCGSNWSGFYALDLEHPEVKPYIAKCLKHYADMGFDFFKLDFLYAASLNRYEGKTRCQVANEAYGFLREVLGDNIILGCGGTLSNCIGRFDFMRIGPDVSLLFDDVWYMHMMHPERISTKVTLKNTVYRSFMNGRLFGNDPDVFLLRRENIKLSDEQKRALLTIKALFGSVLMTADNIAKYDVDQKKLLKEALELSKKATVTGYLRDSKWIRIRYTIDGEEKMLSYDTEKGVLQ